MSAICMVSAGLDAAVHRELEVEAGAARPGVAIVDVAGEALLAAVEVDGGDPLAGFHQGDSDMQGGRGFSRTALFVAQHHNVRRAEPPLTSLHEHDSTPAASSRLWNRGQAKCAVTPSNYYSYVLIHEWCVCQVTRRFNFF